MKKFMSVLMAIMLALTPCPAFAAESAVAITAVREPVVEKLNPGVYMETGVWGDAVDADVREVLQSVMDCFTDVYGGEYVLRHGKPLVIVKALDGTPTTYESLTELELSVTDRLWSKYIYQFSHELYHYTTGMASGDDRHSWFDEALAEAHSFYALDVLAEEWKTDAPYDNWRDYASDIRDYYNNLAIADDFGIYGHDLAEYYKENRILLELYPTVRYDGETGEFTTTGNGNRIVDALSLALYQNAMRGNSNVWAALKVRNQLGVRDDLSFEEYMREWYRLCDANGKATVKKFAGVLEISVG
jgi:hypothetical protein